MAFYDIFNGDADGICALLQLRLAEPRDAHLVTGVKRDIRLLARVQAGAGDALTVLDVSLAENRDDLARLLQAGATCEYFDHHYAGELPEHRGFTAHIDTAPDVCTSLLVDRHLGGAYRGWAVVAAFGDNLADSARSAAEPLGLPDADVQRLQELGEAINYNAYGESLEDLHYHPADLYRLVSRYDNPFRFIGDEPVFEVLRAAYMDDLARAEEVRPEIEGERCAAYLLPDAAWARRVNGVYANRLAHARRARAHAVLVKRSDGAYTVSVRAPVDSPSGADELCRRFQTGGGRKAAAGINCLPPQALPAFLDALRAAYP